MVKKVCFRCGVEKNLSDFYKHKEMADGHLNKCKDCTKSDSDKRHKKIISTPEGLQKERDRHREKYHRLEYKEKHKPSKEDKKKAIEKHRLKYPEKYKAKNASQRLTKKNKKNHLHHWSYKKNHWKDCIEISPKNHSTLHRFLDYDKDSFMYKNPDGILLDSKEKHIEFIKSLEIKIYL